MTLPDALRRMAGALCALALASCATVPARTADDTVAVWASSSDAARKLAKLPPLRLTGEVQAGAGAVVTIDPGKIDQSVVGYGAAMTDASAIVINRLPPARRKALMAELFGRDGLGIAFLRVPIGASDFSEKHYSLDDMPKGQRDPALAHFSMAEPLAQQIPVLREARRINPDLTLMASPWSAPGWMKDSDSLIKGKLRVDAYDTFARYFVRYLDAMAKQELPVRYISVQNEPHFEPENYPGMRFDPADRARFLKEALGPALAGRRQAVGVLEWDHNWDLPQEPLAVLADPEAARHVAGVAWHCYAGGPEVMATVRAAHPDKEVFFSECSGGDWAPDWGGTLGWMTDNLIITPSRSGSRGTLLWNLALDEHHGPHLGGCGDCRGVVTIDSRTGEITRNVEYYVLAQISRFVRPGALRLASEGGGDVPQVAFRNPDGGMVLLAHNSGNTTTQLTVRIAGRQFAATMPGGEVMTFVWRSDSPKRASRP